jgi:hypothetical protein
LRAPLADRGRSGWLRARLWRSAADRHAPRTRNLLFGEDVRGRREGAGVVERAVEQVDFVGQPRGLVGDRRAARAAKAARDPGRGGVGFRRAGGEAEILVSTPTNVASGDDTCRRQLSQWQCTTHSGAAKLIADRAAQTAPGRGQCGSQAQPSSRSHSARRSSQPPPRRSAAIPRDARSRAFGRSRAPGSSRARGNRRGPSRAPARSASRAISRRPTPWPRAASRRKCLRDRGSACRARSRTACETAPSRPARRRIRQSAPRIAAARQSRVAADCASVATTASGAFS